MKTIKDKLKLLFIILTIIIGGISLNIVTATISVLVNIILMIGMFITLIVFLIMKLASRKFIKTLGVTSFVLLISFPILLSFLLNTKLPVFGHFLVVDTVCLVVCSIIFLILIIKNKI